MTVTFDTETIRLISLFENITNVSVKDCLIDNETVYFVVEEGEIAVAIGKNGINVKQAEKMIKKNIKIFEFSNDLATFIKNLIPQVVEVKIKNEREKIVTEVKVEKTNRAVVIGRDGKNLKFYKQLLQRNHRIDEILIR